MDRLALPQAMNDSDSAEKVQLYSSNLIHLSPLETKWEKGILGPLTLWFLWFGEGSSYLLVPPGNN